MFLGAFRRTIGFFLIAFGLGAIITIFMPIWTWILMCAAAIVIVGFLWFIC